MQRTPTCENCQRNYELRDYRPIGPRIPLLLSCGHTFCEGCLTKHIKFNSEFNCFTCQTKIYLHTKGADGIKNLVPNIYLLGLLLYNRRVALESDPNKLPGGPISAFNGIGNVIRERKFSPLTFAVGMENERQENDNLETDMTKLICDECTTKYATCQCKSCDNCKLCDGCFIQVHRGSKTLSRHTPLPLEYPSEEELSCSIHGRSLEFYDQDRKESVCAHCIISEQCKGHEVIPLSDVKEDIDEQLKNSLEKAKLTLFWLEHSNKVLTAALPEEVLETNHLFSEIHFKFTACHTLLLNRQIELMVEASNKLSASKNVNNNLQEISEQIRELSTSIKGYEMVMNDKRVMKLKAKQFLERFNKYSDLACIVQQEDQTTDSISFKIDDSSVTSLDNCGSLVERDYEKFVFKKIDEFSDEDLEKIKTGVPADAEQISLKENEILDERLDLKKTSRLSLLSGFNELVYVTNTQDPLNFKVQRCADKDRLQVMMTSLNKYCRQTDLQEDLVFKAEEGQLVCAQYLDDNSWYRARIVNSRSPSRPDVVPTWQNGLTVEVLYIDYGNSEWLPLNRLHQLKGQFLEIPEMAIPCSLCDIVPPFKEVAWPVRSVNAFNLLTGDRPLFMNIRKRMGGKLYVDLRKPDDDELTLNDDRPVSVRDALVFLEVAVFFSPASHPNADVHRSAREYPKPISLDEGQFVDVIVTHVEDPHSLFIQRLESPAEEEQKHLSKLYSGRNKIAWKIDWPYRNLVCAAKFSVDHTWYRAVVKQVHMNDTVDVEFVDYGNGETLSFHDIKKIPDMYLKLPIQCLKVKLHDVEKLDGEENWSNRSKLELGERFLDKSLVVVVKELEDIPSVELYDTSTVNDINLNKMLVQKGLVKGSGASLEDYSNTVSQLGRKNVMSQAKSEKLCSYPSAVFPSESMFTATGIYVNLEAKIYLHVTDNGDHSLTHIMQDLNTDKETFDKSPKTTSGLYVGQACVAKFTQDQLWYRAAILEVISNTQLKIEYIDFGNSEVVNVQQISAEARFHEIPAQCVSVQLAEIQPNTSNGEWSTEAVDALTEQIVSKPLVISYKLHVAHSPIRASIYLSDGTNIAEVLLWNGLARKINRAMAAAIHNGARSKVNNNVDKKVLTPTKRKVTIEEKESEETKAALFEVVAAKEKYSPEETLPLEETPATTDTGVHHSDYLWFSEQFQPSVGLRFDVTVTQVNQPNIVFIQRLPPADDDPLFCDDSEDTSATDAYTNIFKLEEIEQLINSDGYFDGKTFDYEPKIGMACIGRYTSDSLYYRARIESINNEDKTVDVLYVDYGTDDVISIASLKPMSADLVELPMQSLQVTIVGVKPNPIDMENVKEEYLLKGTEWTIDAMKGFFGMVANKRMIAQIVDVSSTPIKIHLYDRCYVEDSETGETNDVLIGMLMMDNNISLFELDEESLRYV